MSAAILPNTNSPVPKFQKGDLVEVSFDRFEGFEGSYFEATVVKKLPGGKYLVKYEELKRNDWCGPLVEEQPAAMIRPRPNKVVKASFRPGDLVDVFAEDGWWVGQVTDWDGKMYHVFFEKWGVFEYPKKQLRVHQELAFQANGRWECVHNL